MIIYPLEPSTPLGIGGLSEEVLMEGGGANADRGQILGRGGGKP